VVDPGWSHGVQGAIDLTLLTRYYERFADHAVEAGRGVALLAVLPASGCNGGQDAPVAPGVLTRVRHRLGPRPRTC